MAYANTFAPISWVEGGGAVKGVRGDAFDEPLGKRLGLRLSDVGSPWTRTG